MEMINARILHVDTIERFATALVRYEGKPLCAEFIKIHGQHYDWLEKTYGLGQQAAESSYD
jgi:hypothetical protein